MYHALDRIAQALDMFMLNTSIVVTECDLCPDYSARLSSAVSLHVQMFVYFQSIKNTKYI